MKKNWTIITLLCSILFCFTWMFGLGWTVIDYFTGSTNKEPVPAKSTIDNKEKNGVQLLALGDSLTRGTGDDAGKGYIGYLKEQLQAKTKETITLSNYGIKGLTSTQLADQVKQKEIQRQASNANILFLTIGGNDLFQGGQTLNNTNEDSIASFRKTYINNLQTTLTTLRSVNKEAPIYIVGLYNPFSDLDNHDTTSKVVRDWNTETAEICASYSAVIFVPTYDIFQQNVQSILYSDHFHPNTKGYQLMAERVASLITWEVEEK
ncbi:SGNH/GDSL hydrolase family protein [Niallia sp. 01092]|uniref:SGNH/GDSL hydrolase family protein n=1 Tax=unclassified Niallia TaxID=2837522 RepID=UPI003FD45276